MAVEVALNSVDAKMMPMVGMGTTRFPMVPEDTKNAVLAAIEVGYRHFDTAAMYGTEKPLGDAVAEAVRSGLPNSRDEVFVTSKLWCTQCHPDLVLPSIRESLKNLQMEYLDLYLIHWPVRMNPGPLKFPNKREDAIPFDFEGVWRAMEECQRLGLAKAIGGAEPGVAAADVACLLRRQGHPYRRLLAAGRAELERAGQRRDGVAGARRDRQGQGEDHRTVSLRWIYEEGLTSIVKSYNKERLRQNLEIFDWELTEEDRLKISQIPQKKIVIAETLFSPDGKFTSVDPADMSIVEE